MIGTAGPQVAARLFRVAWLSIALGVGMEILILVTQSAFGSVPGMGAMIADTVQKITWSFLVCSGLAIGAATTPARPLVVGIAGLLSGPLGLNVSRAVHKSVNQAMQINGGAAGIPSPVTLTVLKGIEYLILGVGITWIANRGRASVATVLSFGLAVGILFGGIILALTLVGSPQPPPTAALVTRAVNEIAFPVGCALVLFVARALPSLRD